MENSFGYTPLHYFICAKPADLRSLSGTRFYPQLSHSISPLHSLGSYYRRRRGRGGCGEIMLLLMLSNAFKIIIELLVIVSIE